VVLGRYVDKIHGCRSEVVDSREIFVEILDIPREFSGCYT